MLRGVMAEYGMTCLVPGRLLVHWSSCSVRGDPGLGLRPSQDTSTLPQSLTHGRLNGPVTVARHARGKTASTILTQILCKAGLC
jgi:hypothetical protein